MPSRQTKLERPDPTVRYDRYRISTKGQQGWSETRKFLTIAALTAMLADSRGKASGKANGSGKDWDVCRIKFSLADGKNKPKPKPGNEIFRKVDSHLQWIDNPRQRR
ncbi:hypothetical protein TWF730_000087 [Orbilia blumenaviensis]|uniref:Uncharacterized protein n=1 Tax=Orbilia blumenaviensis TaxID=1796055 RepID=A0AAV9VMJ9_9PEZI